MNLCVCLKLSYEFKGCLQRLDKERIDNERLGLQRMDTNDMHSANRYEASDPEEREEERERERERNVSSKECVDFKSLGRATAH